MNRLIFLLPAAFLTSIFNEVVHGQLIAEKGVKVGWSLSTFSTEARDFQDNTFKHGLAVGGYLTFKLTPSFYLQPEVLFSMKGTKQNDPNYGGAGKLEERFTLTYVDVPLIAGYRFHGARLLAGGLLGFYIDGKYSSEYKGGPLDGQKDEEDLESDLTESTDLGVLFGAGYSFKRINLEARYIWGLKNILKPNQDNIELKNRVLQFMLGVSF
jgi:hypothetical protein